MTSRSGAAIALRAVSLRVTVLPKVICQSASASLPTSRLFSTCTSKDGAPNRPCTCSGAPACTRSGTGPCSSTRPLASNARACKTMVSASGGSQRTLACLPAASAAAWASSLPFSSSSCSRQPASGRLRRSVNSKGRPSASWRGKARLTAVAPAAGVGPSPAATVPGGLRRVVRSLTKTASATAATATSAASTPRWARSKRSALTKPLMPMTPAPASAIHAAAPAASGPHRAAPVVMAGRAAAPWKRPCCRCQAPAGAARFR